jgi:S1-C subfamily serine protease
MGIGFAVPSNMIKEITTQLISGNKIQRAMMGVTIQELNDDLREYLNIEKNVDGVLIGSIAKGSPAEKGGIQSGDVVTSFNGKSVDSVSKLKNAVGFSPFGKKLPVEIIRNGKKMKVEVVLEKEFLMSETESFSSEEVAGELGLTLTTDKNNVTVSKVENGSLAFMAGIMEGDIIIAVNKKKVKNVSEVVNIVNKSKSILFLINRKGREFFVVVNR